VEVVVHTLEDLKNFATRFLSEQPNGAIVGLSGELGAGKTTFVRMIVTELSKRAGKASPRVMSPTYVLHQRYGTKPRIDHLDLYRLEKVDRSSLLELQYFDIVDEVAAEKGFVFVEWPERCLDKKLLKLTVSLSIEQSGETRKITY
jgi:tRNA threonylcarbamoyladenosine biosynthesis protein TsaE